MMNELSSLVTGEQVAAWMIIAFIVLYFAYKEWPEFKRRITADVRKESDGEQADKQVGERLTTIERRIASIDEKMQRDYDRLNNLEQELKRNRQSDRDSLEEREIIMRSLLGIIEGLQEIGANGPTKAAQVEIREYLNRKAHRAEKE